MSGGATALHPFFITFSGRLPSFSLELEFRATHYFPHRVRRQFGLDQGIPTTPSFSGSLACVFHTFLFDVATLLPSLRGTAVYIAGLSRTGTYDASFYLYWTGIISSFREFVNLPRSRHEGLKLNRMRAHSNSLVNLCSKHGSPYVMESIDGRLLAESWPFWETMFDQFKVPSKRFVCILERRVDMWTDRGIEIMRDSNPSHERVNSRMPTGSSSRLTASSSRSIAPEESHNGDNKTSPSRDSPSAEQVSCLYFTLSYKGHLYMLIYVLTILLIIK